MLAEFYLFFQHLHYFLGYVKYKFFN